MTTDTVKNAKMTTKSEVNFVFFEMLTTEKSATETPDLITCKLDFGRHLSSEET